MTDRDKNILKWIEEYGSITIYQCSQIFYHGNKCGYDQARKRLRKLYKDKQFKRYRENPEKEVIYYLDKRPNPHALKLLDAIAYFQEFEISDIEKEYKMQVYEYTSYRIDCKAVITLDGISHPLLIEVDYTHDTELEKIRNIIRYLEKKHNTVSYFFVIIRSTKKEITEESVGKRSKILWVNWEFQKSPDTARSLCSLLEKRNALIMRD